MTHPYRDPLTVARPSPDSTAKIGKDLLFATLLVLTGLLLVRLVGQVLQEDPVRLVRSFSALVPTALLR
jgi:hypothetical protein